MKTRSSPKQKPKKAKKKAARKKTTARSKRAAGRKPVKRASKTEARRKQKMAVGAALPAAVRRRSPGGQSGDQQGLSAAERADSESVKELLEEGNAFEADVVAGVEAADDADEMEVRTHEVPEDDVPGEYRDED